ncbi:hypothetical protein LOTGIDRAFT_126999 [Lottia gigantea]|uniref:Superoxide dismutase [Cu-Zn] n=1 Tax=Lottia gigantea TaxID=225164 RepID=V4BH25_LOTGI|nr:hypothetical protein LOTGIDRAFT_126999 [Lottia gigantea]ESO87834.1 hypothetical protein LOTGIDRAFT_126999 [Lottia gigantea]
MGLESDDGLLDHGLHVHKFGDLSDQCQAAGPHYNPFERDHGRRRGNLRHIGDFGNVREDGNGNIIAEFPVPQTSIVGPRSVIGRAVVLHALQDDLGSGINDESRRTGNSGSRLACCVIGRSDSVRSSRTR